jgi:hypothetical protein
MNFLEQIGEKTGATHESSGFQVQIQRGEKP